LLVVFVVASLKTESGEEVTATREVLVLGSCDPISVENFAGVPTLSYTRSMPYVEWRCDAPSVWSMCSRHTCSLTRCVVHRNNVGELTAKGALFKSWFHPGEAVAAMLDLENFPSNTTVGGTLTCVAATLLQHQRYRSCNGSKVQATRLVSESV
jgi:hypothetical protein